MTISVATTTMTTTLQTTMITLPSPTTATFPSTTPAKPMHHFECEYISLRM
jgi:hypothetical protein